MYCKNCGYQIDDDSKFCQKCGTKQVKDELPQNDKPISIVTPERDNINKGSSTAEFPKIIPNKTKVVLTPKYDLTYKKETELIIVAFVFFIIIVFWQVIFSGSSNDPEPFIVIFPFILSRIVGTIWVANVAKKQNRQPAGWIILAFLFPLIAMIIIGLSKKLYAHPVIHPTLSVDENINKLYSKALKFYKDNRFEECIRFCEKALELNPDNIEIKETLINSRAAQAKQKDPSFYMSEIEIETDDKIALRILKFGNKLEGGKVYKGDNLAEDGSYIYNNGTRKIIVQDGKVVYMCHISRHKDCIIEQKSALEISLGDKVFHSDMSVASDGKYSLGNIIGKSTVKDGVIIKI